MAYTLVDNPTHTTIPQHIIDFAVHTAGWESAGANRISAPGADAGISFQIEHGVSAAPYQNRTIARLMDGSTTLTLGFIAAPFINRASQAPTKMHLFCGLLPVPFIAAVVEYAPGFYRHLYLGHMEKLGNYGGGEVVCGSNHFVRNWSVNYNVNEHQYLFSGFQWLWAEGTCGGIRMKHPEVGGTILAPFRASGTRDLLGSDLRVNGVFGGYHDHINDQQLARGTNTYAASQVLVSPNLYLARPLSRISPIGRPGGVRMVNMTGLDGAAPIVVGNKTWRCFPQFRKSESTNVPDAPGPEQNMTSESSFNIGYAYLEG
jgi:hypothetical protein